MCFGSVGSAQNPDLWGPEARVPGVIPAAAAPAWGRGSGDGSGSAEGRAEASAAKVVMARKRIFEEQRSDCVE